MKRGVSCLAAALAAVTLGASEPPKQGNQQQSASASQPAPMRIPLTDFPRKEDRGCKKGEQRRDSDLCAQWEAADAARAAADAAESANRYSWWTLLAGGLGTLFLLGSLIQAWRTSRAELRAYVNAEIATLTSGLAPTPNWPQPLGLPACFLLIKNSGQTPAYKVRHWADIRFCRVRDQACLTYPPIEDKHALTIPPGGSITKRLVLQSPLSPDQIAALHRGYATIFIFGRVEYRDVFGKRRFSEYRLQHGGAWPPQGEVQLWFSEAGNHSD